MFDNYEDFFKKSDADIEELTYGQMMHALAGETGSTKHTHITKFHHNHHNTTVLPTKAPRLIDGNYYEWVEADKRWIKIIEDSPEPPANWEPGLFDGEIRKYIPQ